MSALLCFALTFFLRIFALSIHILSMNKYFLSVLCLGACFLVTPAQTVFNDEASDTVRINRLLIDAVDAKLASPGDALAYFAEKFVGTPYVSGTLEGEPEYLRVNLDGLDCTTFVESMMALAATVDERRSSWRDFVYNLQDIRYRDGKINGYPSRLHYISDWAVDNIRRGRFTDITNRFPKCNYVVKTIDFMSTNRDQYPALADSANFAQIKKMEICFRRYRYPFIKTGDLSLKSVSDEFRNGDVLAFTSSLKNLDVSHMGLVVIRDGVPYVAHASSSAGKVVLSELPLDKFMKKNRQFTGVRVFRLNRQ